MDESSTAGQCFAAEMTAALGPYDEFVDILVGENFRIWHNRAGLRCLVCTHPVEVYQSSRKNPYVRHGKGHGAPGSALERKTAGETFQHRRFKHWVCHELRQRGVDAAVEVWQDGRRPDIAGTRDGHSYAVEIQWSPLSFTEADARTEHHRRAGDPPAEVLWLTRSCNWVEKLPALGIKSFTPTAAGGYVAHTGHLQRVRRAALRVESIAIRDFLDAWLDGHMAWGHRDTDTAGWATVTDWEKYTSEQADDLAALRRDLTTATSKIGEQAATLRGQRARITALEDTTDRQQQDLAARTAALKAAAHEKASLSDSISSATRRIAELREASEQSAGDLGNARRQIAERDGQLLALAAALAARTRYLRILLVVVLVLAIAAVAGWV